MINDAGGEHWVAGTNPCCGARLPSGINATFRNAGLLYRPHMHNKEKIVTEEVPNVE
jgi:hypothetical protein